MSERIMVNLCSVCGEPYEFCIEHEKEPPEQVECVPILKAREMLLGNEPHEAALDAQIRICGRASDRATEAAIAAAFDAAFPAQEDS